MPTMPPATPPTAAAAVDAALARIARWNPVYRAFSHLAPDARTAAQALDAAHPPGAPRGALHGLTASVKGNFPVAGLPFTEGSGVHADRVATTDADVVTRLRAAGAIVLGTTTLSEMAMYGVTNPFEPMGLNPWDVTRTAGGSSTGAGVAASLGLATVNVGNDSGGSVRNPACHCGVVGFMPSIDAIAGDGAPNHTPSLTSTGLLVPDVALATRAWLALAARPGRAPATPRRRLLVPRALVDTMCDEETLALFAAAETRLAAAGFALVDADVEGWLDGERAAGVVSLFESGRALATMDLARASEGLRTRLANARKLAPEAIGAARAACERLRLAVHRALDAADADAIVTPTWPFPAPPIEATTMRVRDADVPVDPHRNCFVRAANAIDACALTLPMGLYPSAGVPAGLHLLAPGGRERDVLATAALVESALPRLPLPPPLR